MRAFGGGRYCEMLSRESSRMQRDEVTDELRKNKT